MIQFGFKFQHTATLLLLVLVLTGSARGQMPTVGAGMIETKNATSPTGSAVWFWGAPNLFRHIEFTSTTSEIVDVDGFPLASVRAVLESRATNRLAGRPAARSRASAENRLPGAARL